MGEHVGRGVARRASRPRRAAERAPLSAHDLMEAFLAFSRELATARLEDDIIAAVARALGVLFPGRCFCISLLDASTLALTAVHARGELRQGARERVALRRAAVRKLGLSEGLLAAGGVAVVEADEPSFEGCE